MKHTYNPFRYLIYFAFFITSLSSYSSQTTNIKEQTDTGLAPPAHSITTNSAAIEEQANSSIRKLYHTLNTMPNTSMADRISQISAYFKGTKYILGSLGEGPNARYDQFPRYRVDGFDCDTYVNTVLSLALANSLESFQECLKHTRYKNGKRSYINRNHFTSIDWNDYNQKRGLLKDITFSIRNEKKQPVALYANALINKPQWYNHKTIDTIRLQKQDKNEQEKRLVELKAKGKTLETSLSNVPYIPFTALFSENKPNLHLFSQIPNGAVIEIIRPNWDLRQQIGTELDISHLGFAIWINNELFFRQASSQYGKVVDVSLIDYLDKARSSPTIKGINIQVVLPEKPVSNGCQLFDIR